VGCGDGVTVHTYRVHTHGTLCMGIGKGGGDGHCLPLLGPGALCMGMGKGRGDGSGFGMVDRVYKALVRLW